jgi:hypothetical protein
MDNKDNGMMTKIWGPPGWLFLHSITFGYPYLIDINNREHLIKRQYYRNFFMYLGKVFPCRYCRESYEEFIKEIPLDKYLNSREDLCYWLYLIHNKVNYKLGIPKCDILNFKDVKKKYETFRAECKKTTNQERNINLKKECKKTYAKGGTPLVNLSNKGCVIPKDGVFKKCQISIITSDKNSVNKKLVTFNLYYIIFFILFIIIINILILFFFLY